MHPCCLFFISWNLRSSKLPVKQLSSRSNSWFGICLQTEWKPLPNTTHPDYTLCGGDTGIEALYKASHLCFPARMCIPASLISLWTVAALQQVSLEIFLPLLDLLLLGHEERASKHPMIRAGWGLLAALKQDLLGHPIHLHHNCMLLLGDYVSLSSLCNYSYAHKQCK